MIFFSFFLSASSYSVGYELDGTEYYMAGKEVSAVDVVENVEDGTRLVSGGEEVVFG